MIDEAEVRQANIITFLRKQYKVVSFKAKFTL